MDFELDPELEQFRKDVREFLAAEFSPAKVAPHRDTTEFYGYTVEFVRAFKKKLGSKGFLDISWPKEYGGQGKSRAYHAFLSYELTRQQAPGLDVAQNIIPPPLMLFGSQEQKRTLLPRIARGELIFCLGYSEPGSGSDLASLQTKATPDGDWFVINGQKTFTTNAHNADYCWMAVRTDPDAPKHKGISLFIVDTKTPGITIRPLMTMAGWRHNEVFFDNVRVHKNALVGELNKGWYYLATALEFERSGFHAYGAAQRLLEELIAFCKTRQRNHKPLIADPIVRAKLAQMAIDIAIGWRFSLRVAWLQHQGMSCNVEASINKVWGSELAQRMASTAIQIAGLSGLVRDEDKGALNGFIAWDYLNAVAASIGAGVNEVQRDILARRGLGMPR